MDLLNSKTILDCDEKEEEIHNEEIERFLKLILNLPNYECAMIFKREDLNNQKEIIKACMFHEVLDNIDYVDIKNGVDLFVEDGILHIYCYGQHYTIDQTNKLVLNNIQVLPYNENREFLDLFSNVSEIKEYVQNGKVKVC